MKANAPSSCQPVGNIFPNGDSSNNNDVLFDTVVTSKPKPDVYKRQMQLRMLFCVYFICVKV